MGRKIVWIDSDFKGLIPALVAKRADLAMSAIYVTDERRKLVDFSDPYFAGGLVVLTTRSGPIKRLKDLDGRRVSGIAVRKDAPEIRNAVNAALKRIKADGSYDRLVNKWFEAGK